MSFLFSVFAYGLLAFWAVAAVYSVGLWSWLSLTGSGGKRSAAADDEGVSAFTDHEAIAEHGGATLGSLCGPALARRNSA